MNETSFREAARAIGFDLQEPQIEALRRFHELLRIGNERAKLTSVLDEAGFWRTHVLDSLSIVRALAGEPAPRTLVDVGSGAGIPAIPLAIALPGLTVLAVESIEKKARFIDEAAERLGLAQRLTVDRRRAEEVGRDERFRDHFDVGTARALAALPVACELVLPLVKPGGLFIAYKGPKVDEELSGGRKAAGELNARVLDVMPSGIEGTDLRLVRVRKLGPTPPGFPRKTGVPGKRPLG